MISDVATKRGCSIPISCYGSDTNAFSGAKGYNQIPGVDFTESFAPVVHDMTWRLFLTIALGNDEWEWSVVDIEVAFLYGKLEEEVYMEDEYEDDYYETEVDF